MKKSPPEVLCMGEILIDFVATPSGRPLVESETFVRKPGGAVANVAVGLSRLGRTSAFVGMVGDDAFGDFLRKTLEIEEVDVSLLGVTEVQPTTLAFVALDRKGIPSFSFYRHPGADLSIRPEDVRSPLFETAKVFHFGSLSLVQNPAMSTTYHCLDLAEASKLMVTYDPNYRPALWSDEDSAVEAMSAPLDRVDLLKVSEEELTLLTGEVELERGCRKIATRGPKTIVVTLGSEGLFGWSEGYSHRVPGIEVEPVDTTGCGDASMAGLLAYLLEHHPESISTLEFPEEGFRKALEYANRCAAHAATIQGAIPSLPREGEV